ncbi:uncharacterized protein L3040_005800 [Drepanopeziza brunnea f. sp. 'multigermtubi']|uniref:uncharacterized protein n=1 Tax=Drepanopeziza brunnea f. sp. 'multigermtubi' TaxID=698441 RepID=UPI00239FFB69|nr:hypothetical protein L3040_005800 [Drepanopeziza brunnea f. sp. 'multigermtubi']
MHASSSSAFLLRPRSRTRTSPRTITSCTECRRRKQRCNQAKDRQCNNCARRYPPVVCTYQSLSPPPASNPAVDTRDANDASVRQQDNSLACPADIPMPQPDFAALSSSSSSSSISISSPTSTSTPSSSYLSQSYYTVVEYSHYSPAEILTLSLYHQQRHANSRLDHHSQQQQQQHSAAIWVFPGHDPGTLALSKRRPGWVCGCGSTNIAFPGTGLKGVSSMGKLVPPPVRSLAATYAKKEESRFPPTSEVI